MFWVLGPLVVSGALAVRARKQLQARNARMLERQQQQAAQQRQEQAVAASPVFGGAAAEPQPAPAQPTFRAAVEPGKTVLKGFEAAVRGILPGEPQPVPTKAAPTNLREVVEQARQVAKQPPALPSAVLAVKAVGQPPGKTQPPGTTPPTQNPLHQAAAAAQHLNALTTPPPVLSVVKAMLPITTKQPPETFSPGPKGKGYQEL